MNNKIDKIISDSRYYVDEYKSKSNEHSNIFIGIIISLILSAIGLLGMIYSTCNCTKTTESERVADTKKYKIRYDEDLPERYFTDDEFNEILGMFQYLSVKLSGNPNCKYDIVHKVHNNHNHYIITNFNNYAVIRICRNANTIKIIKGSAVDDLKYCKSLSKVMRLSMLFDKYMTRKEANKLYNYLYNDYKN